jgi:hypothetical protein
LAFIGAKRRAFTEEADGSGAGFGQEGQAVAGLPTWRGVGSWGKLETAIYWDGENTKRL